LTRRHVLAPIVSAVIASQRVARMPPDDRLREAIHLAT
jgi:hypothetical protein